MQLNIDCDRIASETTGLVADNGVPDDMPPLIRPPYPGSRAMLKIGRRWITSNFKQHLYDARRTPPVRTYMKEKYGWTDDIFDSIDWLAIGRCRRKLPLRRKRQTCKIMHGWLPTMDKNFTTTTSQCPGCPCRNETTNHMIICSHARMRKKREEIITALRKKGLGGRTSRAISNAVCDILENYFLETDRPFFLQYDPAIQAAVRSQYDIRPHMFIRGFIATKWHLALKEMGVSQPVRTMKRLLLYLWDNIVTPLWDTRNDLYHHSENLADEADDSQLTNALIWYLQHKNEVVSIYDQRLLQFDISDLQTMSRRTKREWKRHLDIARDAWTQEKTQLARSQQVITRFIQPRNITARTVPVAPQPRAT